MNKILLVGDGAFSKALYKVLTENEENELTMWSPNTHFKKKKLNMTYALDACDCVPVKIKLIEVCSREKIKLITCMGTANKTHPEMLQIVPLKNTQSDPLAKKIRNKLSKNPKAMKSMCVCSLEVPKHQALLGTICAVPMAAGAMMSSYVINDIKKEAINYEK